MSETGIMFALGCAYGLYVGLWAPFWVRLTREAWRNRTRTLRKGKALTFNRPGTHRVKVGRGVTSVNVEMTGGGGGGYAASVRPGRIEMQA